MPIYLDLTTLRQVKKKNKFTWFMALARSNSPKTTSWEEVMKLLSIMALVLGMGSAALAGNARCNLYPWSGAAIQRAEISYKATVDLANKALNEQLTGSWQQAFDEQAAAGVFTPADEANLRALAAVMAAQDREGAFTAQTQATINSSHANYMKVYNRNTFSCYLIK